MSSPRKTSSALNKQRKWRGVDLAGAINSQSVPKGGDLGILMGVGVLPWHCTVTVHSVEIKRRHPKRSLTRMCWQWMKGGWKKIYMYHILSPLIFLKVTLWMWLGCIFLIAFCSTSFVLIYIEYIIYSCILEHISSCLFNKRTERQNTPTSSDVMNTNRVQPHLEQTTSQSWQFHQNNNFDLSFSWFMCQNESWKKNVSVCLGFPVIGYACQVQEVQPTEVKGYNVQLIGCENDTARVHPSTVISLGQSTESSPTVFRKWYMYNQSHMLINVTSHMKLSVFFPTYMTMINSKLMT